tara:strand:+ start:1616 stop:2329 length:714 start_codon:yes stop_codon:yes gene_type:complete
MAQLNQKQVDSIYDLLISHGLSYESLQVDVLDHICCMVEQKMDNGLEFDESLSTSTQEFGLSKLSEIQEATFHLLTLKLNKMKKVVGIVAIVTALSVILGIVFKINHYLGAGFMVALGFTLAALVVFPSMMYFDLKNQSNWIQKGATISGYAAGILLSVATLFKFMHWPGFFMLYYTGLFSLIFVFLPLYTFRNYKTSENKIFALAKSMLIMAGVVTIWASYKMADHARAIAEMAIQ